MDSESVVIDTQMPYHWKPEYLPIYRGLSQAREVRELTKDEKKLCEWFSYSLMNKLFKDMT